MAKDKETTKLSWPVPIPLATLRSFSAPINPLPTALAVKRLCSPDDIDRLACLAVAFLNDANVDKYKEAAEQFGDNIKPDSYKRSIWVITKKIEKAGGGEEGEGGGGARATKTGGPKGGKKREEVADVGDGDDDEGEETPKPRKVKVIQAGKVGEGLGEALVKSEPAEEGEEEGLTELLFNWTQSRSQG